MKKIKELIQQKHKGNAMDLIVTGICIVFIMIAILAGINFMEILQQKQVFNSYVRSLMLLDETEGTITQAELDTYKNYIEEYGFDNVEIYVNGNAAANVQPAKNVPYGNEVQVTVTATMTTGTRADGKGLHLFAISWGDMTMPWGNEQKFSANLKSTSKIRVYK